MLLVVVDLRCLVFWLLTPFQGSVPEVMTTKYSHSATSRHLMIWACRVVRVALGHLSWFSHFGEYGLIKGINAWNFPIKIDYYYMLW